MPAKRAKSDKNVTFTLRQIAGQNLDEGKKSPAITVTDKEQVVGSGEDCAFRVVLDNVSEHHAAVKLIDGVPTVSDLGSAFGTFVNFGRINEPKPLRRGDLVSLGRDVVFLLATRDASKGAADAKDKRRKRPTVVSKPPSMPVEDVDTAPGDTPDDTPSDTPTAEGLAPPQASDTSPEHLAVGAETPPGTTAETAAVGTPEPRHLAALVGLLERVDRISELQQLLTVTLHELETILDASSLYVFLRVQEENDDEERTHTRTRTKSYSQGDFEQLELAARRSATNAVKPGSGLVQRALRSGTPVLAVVPSTGSASAAARDYASDPAPGSGHEGRAVLCAPLSSSIESVGVIYADRPLSRGHFGPGDARFLTTIGRFLSMRMELLHVSQEVRLWADAHDRLSQTLNKALPDIGSMLEDHLRRIEAITDEAETNQGSPLLANILRAESDHLRTGLQGFLRWVQGDEDAAVDVLLPDGQSPIARPAGRTVRLFVPSDLDAEFERREDG